MYLNLAMAEIPYTSHYRVINKLKKDNGQRHIKRQENEKDYIDREEK
jgi:hypothetical protein